MSTNFLPEKVVRTRGDGNGGYFSEIYTLESWTNLSLIGLFLVVFFIASLLPFVALILLLGYCSAIYDRQVPFWYNIFSLIASGYFLYDFHRGWYLSKFVKDFGSEGMLYFELNLNAGLILAHLVLLFIGSVIYDFVEKNNFLLTIVVGIMLFIFYHIGAGVVNSMLIKP